MPAPSTTDDLLELVRKSGLVEDRKLDAYLQKLQGSGSFPAEPNHLAGILVRDGILTQFQAEQILLGKWRRFHIGKYKVLERIGSGGMGSVYLCEHTLMRRRVAVKVLPTSKSDDTSARERFLREARAVAALDHPNIVRAYDIDQDSNLHFLVMEYVDGSNLQEIVKRTGALDVRRAVHYIAQSALALQHAHEVAGIVHRDIKPGNILVDRNGVVKVLDMGLARFFYDEEDLLTQKYDENVLGTADYLAPEQALDSHSVDIRADIYGLGATLYFCLTGKAPFSEGTVAQKLIWHQTRQPKSVRAHRPEIPEEVAIIVERMMAKDPNQRFQTPLEIAQALTIWTQTPIAPPPEVEMPRLSPAASGMMPNETGRAVPFTPVSSSGPGSSRRKVWQVPQGTPSNDKARSTPPLAAPAGPPPSSPSPPTPPPPPEQAAAAVTTAACLTEGRDAAEPVSWKSLTADTLDAVAQSDTVPHQARPRRAPISKTAAALPFPQGPERQKLILWAVTGGVVLLAIVLGLWAWVGGSGKARQQGRPETGPSPQILRVQRGSPGQANTFPSLREAMAAAKDNARIRVFDEVIEEQLAVDARLPRDITIESGLETRSVVWRAPAQPREGEPLLRVNGVEGLRVRAFAFDGQGRMKDLVTISGICPGLGLEDVQLSGFTVRGLVVVNCEGRADKPVKLTRIRIQRSNARELGMVFDAHPKVRDGINNHVVVTDCQIEGGGPTGGVVMTSSEAVKGVRFRGSSPQPEMAKPQPEKAKSNPEKAKTPPKSQGKKA